MGSRYGQDVEAKGTYVLEKDFDGPVNKPWIEGRANIKNPLIININDDTLISYKYDLAKQYKAKGKRLTEKLMSKGCDAIVTLDEKGQTGEIILFSNCEFMLSKNESKIFIKNLLRESLLPESINGGVYNVFHGSEAKINKFVDNFVGSQEAIDQEGPGIYFSSHRPEAESYGNFLYSAELTPRVLYDQTPTNPKKLKPIIEKLVRMAPDWESNAENYDENPEKGLKDFIESTLNYNDNEKDCILQVWIDFYRYNPVDYVRNCVKLGIDGIIVDTPRSKHFIIYNPNIIKVK